MDDVASARNENLNLRKIQHKLLQWEKKDCSLSPLTQFQNDVIEQLNECLQQKSPQTTSKEVSKFIHHQKQFESGEQILIEIIQINSQMMLVPNKWAVKPRRKML